MTSEMVTLADIGELTVGGVWGEEEAGGRATEGVLCLRGVDIDALASREPAKPPLRFVSDRQLDSRRLAWGDILIEASGSNCGRSLAIRESIKEKFDRPLVYSNFCKRFRIRDVEAWDPGYVWRALQAEYASGLLQTFRTGSAVPNLDVKRLIQQVNVKVRPIIEQRAVAAILDLLEDAIENLLVLQRLQADLLLALVDRHADKAPATQGAFSLTIGGEWGEDEPKDGFTPVYCLRGKDLENYFAGSANEMPIRYLKPNSVSKRTVQPGDVLTAGSGTLGPSLLVTETIVDGFDLPITYSNFVKRFRPRTGDMSGVLLFAELCRLWRTGAIEKYKTGTAMPNLDGKGLVRSLAVPQLPGDTTLELMGAAELLLSPTHIKTIDSLRDARDLLLKGLLSGTFAITSPERIVGAA